MKIFLYKTTNIINNKFYIGVHKTLDEEDSYLGSGKYLNESIKFYGKKNFKREILEYFQTEEEAYYKESLVVNTAFLKREDTYNIALGGNRPPYHSGKTHPHFGKKRPDASKRMKENNPGKLEHNRQFYRNSVVVKDIMGNTSRVLKTDPKYISGELIPVNKGNKPWCTGIKMKQIICPYCNKEGAGGAMKRFHFENCKRKGASV